jgi:nucleolar protein 56
MAKHYIFSNCTGTFLFSTEFSVEKFVPAENPKKNFELISKGIVPDEEKTLYSANPACVILRTGSAVKEFASVSDKILIFKALSALKSSEYFPLFRTADIAISKKCLSESISPDLLIIQAVNAITELSKSGNTLSKRLREWYELYNPEISRRIEDHYAFARMVSEKSKDEILAEIGIKQEDSMGGNISPEEVASIISLSKEVCTIFGEIENQQHFLEAAMNRLAPKLTESVGFMIGAKLIFIAGSLKHLSEMPSSKIQVLGAEKALFRHLKTGARPPKYGVISQHPDIAAAGKDDKGKAARKVAAKASIAAKVDFFRKRA